MSKRGKELREDVARYLTQVGVKGFEFSHSGSTHQRVTFMLDGREFRFTFGLTPSDCNSHYAVVRILKRRMAEWQANPRGA